MTRRVQALENERRANAQILDGWKKEKQILLKKIEFVRTRYLFLRERRNQFSWKPKRDALMRPFEKLRFRERPLRSR